MKKSMALALFGVGALLAACAWQHDLTDRDDLSGVFMREYGVELPAAISEIRGRDVGVGDTWSLWLSFSYHPGTVRQIVQRGGFVQARAEEIDGGDLWSRGLYHPGPNAPDWWQKPSSDQAKVYYRKSHARDVSGFAFLWIDESSGVVYASSAAWH